MKLSGKLLSLIHAVFFIFFPFRTFSDAYDCKLILLTSDRGIVVSENGGRSWTPLNAGLPGGIIPQNIQCNRSGDLYLTTRSSGIFRFEAAKARWEDLNTDLFLSPLSLQKEYRKISAFTVSNDGREIAVATKHAVFRKKKDKPWERVREYRSENYCSALAFNIDALFAGTSYNGIFRMQNSRRQRALNISSGLPREQYSDKYFFYEEIAGVASGGGNTDILYAALNFGGGVYISLNGGVLWKSLKFPVQKNKFYGIYDIKAEGETVYVSSEAGIFKMDGNSGWHSVQVEDMLRKLGSRKENLSVLIVDKAGSIPALFYRLNDFRRKKDYELARRAGAKKAIYSNAYSLNKNLRPYIETIKKSGLNSVVIDIKDDWGDICFASVNRTALEINAVKKYFDIKNIIAAFRKNGIYTIARIVVFKDKRIYNSYGHKYAIRDKVSAGPWKGNPREFWNDPFSDFVRNYNIEIAEEAERAGFDEIQFDYIRFPSDGPIERCDYRFKKSDAFKSEILACFLEEAKNRIRIPISVDIYGFNAWFRMGNRIGQDAELFAEIADVVCPMVYPSHYGKNFFANIPAGAKPYRIVLESVNRAGIITLNNAVVRPYLQAFNLLSPTWGPEYIKSQIKAALDGGCSGYSFWNAGGIYDMVKEAAGRAE